MDLLTAEELAAKLRIRPSTVRTWTRAKRIPAIRLAPKVVRYDLRAVVEMLAGSQGGSNG